LDKKFIIAMAIPAIVIIGFLSFKIFTVTTGQDILLEIPRPVDPTDLFRGNYVNLRYSISNLNLNNTQIDYNFSGDEIVYAVLSKKEKFWTIDALYHSRPQLSENQVCMRGEVTSVYKNQIHINWGVESFFSPKEQAQEVEKERWRSNVSSIVTVDKYCNSVLKALLVGNETVQMR